MVMLKTLVLGLGNQTRLSLEDWARRIVGQHLKRVVNLFQHTYVRLIMDYMDIILLGLFCIILIVMLEYLVVTILDLMFAVLVWLQVQPIQVLFILACLRIL